MKYRVVFIFISFLMITGCSASKHEKCVQKGVQYFEEVDAYPYLSDGRDAKKVAEERCHRSRIAFGEI